MLIDPFSDRKDKGPIKHLCEQYEQISCFFSRLWLDSWCWWHSDTSGKLFPQWRHKYLPSSRCSFLWFFTSHSVHNVFPHWLHRSGTANIPCSALCALRPFLLLLFWPQSPHWNGCLPSVCVRICSSKVPILWHSFPHSVQVRFSFSDLGFLWACFPLGKSGVL